MNVRIEQVLRALLSNIQVLNAELKRLERDEQLRDSLVAARLLKEIAETYALGAKLLSQLQRAG